MRNLALFILSAGLLLLETGHSYEAKPRANFSVKFLGYTQSINQSLGQNLSFEFENKSQFSEQIMLTNQFRSKANSFHQNTTNKTSEDREEEFEFFLGENYLQHKTDNHILQLGYQTVIWGEAFGFNYADFINPRDLRESVYTELAQSRRPLLLLNSKTFITTDSFSGSLQLLISPEPRFDRTLPLEFFLGDSFAQQSFAINKERKIQAFSEYEYGAKASLSAKGYDFSIFYYDLYNRSPYYEIKNINNNIITLNERHARQNNYGASIAKSLSDFMLRADLVFTPNYTFNSISSFALINKESALTNFVIGIDTPTYNDYSAAIVFAQSELSTDLPLSFRSKSQKFSILKVTKNFEGDKSLECSLTHELKQNGFAFQSAFNIPLTNLTEIKLGAEYYIGNQQSYLKNLKRMNNVYISLKNFIKF